MGPEHAADQAHSITGMAAAAAGAPLAYAAGSAMAENLDLLNGVATWSTARLSEVQHVDPEAFATLKTSIAALLKALTQLLSNATGPDMEGFGEALSLTVQAMLTDLRGGDPEQVAALNAAAAEAVAASGGLAGTDMRMLLGITAGTIGLVVSSVPPVGYDRMSDVLGDDTDEIPSRCVPFQPPTLWHGSNPCGCFNGVIVFAANECRNGAKMPPPSLPPWAGITRTTWMCTSRSAPFSR